MPTSLVAHEQAISRIFSNDYVFSIPDYQRPYAWTIEQSRDLYEDLTGFMRGHQSVEEMPPYFLGSVVLIKSDSLPNADVVDGSSGLQLSLYFFRLLEQMFCRAEATTSRSFFTRRAVKYLVPKTGIGFRCAPATASSFKSTCKKKRGFHSF